MKKRSGLKERKWRQTITSTLIIETCDICKEEVVLWLRDKQVTICVYCLDHYMEHNGR